MLNLSNYMILYNIIIVLTFTLTLSVPADHVLTFSLTLSVPADHVVVTKERASGMYHLSAYFMAKLLSELPLMLFTPSLFHIITYWIIGLAGVGGFFGTWLVIILTCLVGQVSI